MVLNADDVVRLVTNKGTHYIVHLVVIMVKWINSQRKKAEEKIPTTTRTH